MPAYHIKPSWPRLAPGDPLARGLVRALDLGAAGGSALRDHSRLGADLTFSAAPARAAGPCGPAARMTGYATGSPAGLPLGAADRTFSFLFRPSAADGSTLLGYGDASNNNAFRIYAWTDGTLMCDTWFDNFTTTVTVQDGGWHHAALRVVGRLATWFLDGRRAGSHLFANLNTTVGSAGVQALAFALATEPENPGTQRYGGWLDAVKAWDRGLSDAELGADAADPFRALRGRRSRAGLLAAASAPPPPPAGGRAPAPTRHWYPRMFRSR